MNPITPNISNSYQNSPRTSSNTENAPVSQNHPTWVERQPGVRIIREGLNDASTLMESPSKRLMYFLYLASTKKNPTINIKAILTLLDQIKDEELSGTKAEFIVKNIIHNDSLSPYLRWHLGTGIYRSDLGLAKDILQNTVEYNDYSVKQPISIDLINNALEHQKLELYEAFASNASFPLNVRIRESCARADTSQKTELFKVLTQELEKLFGEILNGKKIIHDCDISGYLRGVMEEFNKNEWIQTPQVQNLIKLNIERETKNILEATHFDEETNLIIFTGCYQYYDDSEGKLDIKAIVQAAVRALPTLTHYDEETYKALEVELSSYEKLGLIHEEPIQELLGQIGMNQCREFENDLDCIFVALKYIENAAKKICILNNLFTKKLQRKTFKSLEDLESILNYHLGNLNQEELSTILGGISQSIDGMLVHSKCPDDFIKKLKFIHDIFNVLYENIYASVIRQESIQNIIFSTKTQSLLKQGRENPYEAYLKNKDLRGISNLLAAFTEVIADPVIRVDFRPEIKELLNPSKTSIHCEPHPYEQRLSEYYFAILEKYYELLCGKNPHELALNLLYEHFELVKSKGVIIPYFITQLEKHKLNKFTKAFERIDLNETP